MRVSSSVVVEIDIALLRPLRLPQILLVAVLLTFFGAKAHAQQASSPIGSASNSAPAYRSSPEGASSTTLQGSALATALPSIEPGDASAVPAPVIPASLLPRDLSPWQMFLSAAAVVKAVMLLLAFASVLTWTVCFSKSLELAQAKRRVQVVMGAFSEAASLNEIREKFADGAGPAGDLVAAAVDELQASTDLPPEGIRERIAIRLERIEVGARQAIARGTGVLATIGSIAPFVGLFGTVWGIMHSFIGISRAQTTNLAIVAPGIAEALLATALGLVAAIPAVVIYNAFTRSITGYRTLLEDVSAQVMRLVSRDLDQPRDEVPSRAKAAR